jgi:hypothetical protein
MKLLLIGLLALSGCTLTDSYLMTHYDGNEYKKIIDIRMSAHVGAAGCKDPIASADSAKALASQTLELQYFEEHIPHNTNAYNAAVSLNEIAQGLVVRYNNPPVPVVFCKIKFESIEHSAAVIQHVIGNRPR